MNINSNRFRVRRKTIDGKYILYVNHIYSNKIYEFIGDDKGVIKVFNKEEKKGKQIKPFFQKPICSIETIKLKSKDLKSYKDNIYNIDSYLIPVFNDKPIITVPIFNNNTNDRFKINSNNIQIKVNDIDIRTKSIVYYNKRKNKEPNLTKIVSIVEFIIECVNNSIINESDMDKKLTDMIYEKVY
jgi:hypothetical protein